MTLPNTSLTEKGKGLILLELHLKLFRQINWTSCPVWLKKTECRVFGEIVCKLKGIAPHSNGKLQIVRSLNIKKDWRTNPNHSYKQEIKRC